MLVFYGGGIGAELVSGNEGRLLGLLHDPLVNLLSALLAKQSKGPTQIAKIWNRVFIKSGEASIEQTGSQFAVKLAIRPTFDVFEHQRNAATDPERSLRGRLCWSLGSVWLKPQSSKLLTSDPQAGNRVDRGSDRRWWLLP